MRYREETLTQCQLKHDPKSKEVPFGCKKRFDLSRQQNHLHLRTGSVIAWAGMQRPWVLP